MKILLTAINAKYIHSNLAVYSLQAYAGKYLNDQQAGIVIAEYTINNPLDEILEGLYKEKPDILCFSCYIWNMRYVGELIREYHKLCPSVPIWVGGPEVSYEAEQFLEEYPMVTGVMLGEGEQTFLELCRYYEAVLGCGQAVSDAESKRQDGLKDISGLAYRDGDSVYFTKAREPIDMDAIPFCYDKIEDFTNRIIYYESSRGCPFRCSYCLSSVEKQLRFRSLSLVKEELRLFLEKEVPQIKFVDRTFNCIHEHAMEIWKFIKENDNGVTNFHFEISADLLTEEEIVMISTMRPGLIQLEIGVQSTNPATITEIHRTMDLSRLKEVVKKIQKGNNIHEHLDLIAGLPFEDYDTFARSFDEIYALKPNQLQLGFLKVLKGSYMYDHAKEYGIVYHDEPPYEVMRTKWLDFQDILRIRQVEEMLEVYYNSGQYEVTMKLLETQFSSAFSMYLQFGEFYEKKGYFKMSHARLRRAEIVLEFAKERAETALPVLKESLVYDLYARENVKSRPAWAADMAEWKALSRRCCRNGKQSHVERFFYRFPDKSSRMVHTLPEKEVHPLYVMFDYTKRDALDHQAFWNYVEE